MKWILSVINWELKCNTLFITTSKFASKIPTLNNWEKYIYIYYTNSNTCQKKKQMKHIPKDMCLAIWKKLCPIYIHLDVGLVSWW